ncbi:sulfatase-like hydrolase/transferase [Pistricoccus aurantiacus]|uniref:sulfatase-like hydrolase/transferase n=1 Tax=Pistricoccus aurantiacus TaxID=1883414 RepID=UPI0036385CF5
MTTLLAVNAFGALVLLGIVFSILISRSRWVLLPGLLGFVYVLFWGVWQVADMMTGVGINQSVLFHFFSGTEDADYRQFLKEIVVFAGFVTLAVSVLAGSVFQAWRNRVAAKPVSRASGFLPSLIGCGVVIIGWLISPWHLNLLALKDSYVALDADQTRKLRAMYDTSPRRITSDKNLVVLYLESVESTYFDERLFPELLPALRERRGESLHFSGIAQTPGTGWTIAGLVNTQCGLPLATPGAGDNDMGRVRYFLPKAKCLAEHLQDNGFRTVYMGGASGKFAGKDRFLEQHGFDVVRDKEYFSTWKGMAESEFSGWGAYDDELLEGVFDEFVTLSEKQEPFALFALTMDTHHPHGHISPSCRGVRYRDGKLKSLNALACADRLVSRFIDRVRASPWAADTTLVVLSDHLAMVNDATPLIEKAKRRDNLLMVFDSDIAPGERRVQGTMLDVGPTLLSLMRADTAALGFGRSLLEPGRSNQAYSRDYFASDDVMEYLSFSRTLWDMPQVVGQIRSDGDKGILLGGNQFEAPFFSVLNESNKVIELYFYNFSQHLADLQEGVRYLYARECEEVKSPNPGICLVAGLKGVGEKVFSSTELVEGVSALEAF